MTEFLLNTLNDFFKYSEETPWLFTRFSFWIFFVFTIGGYSFFYKKVRSRNIYLLLISFFFYYKTGGWFLFLLILSCVSNFWWGWFIGIRKNRLSKKVGLFLGVATNLSLLVYFKYAYFFTNVINKYTHNSFETYNWLAAWWNSLTFSSIDTTEIILPVGISFFTFQAISYLVDVYKGKTMLVKNIFDFSFYLSFFPQLVAGPIVRASNFIPQLYRKYQLTKQEFGHALFLILTGLMKKLILSNYLAINFVDRVFDAPGSYSGAENIMAVYGYALQIYADFSGYTDMAIGIALLLGFKLPINFNSPYKANSLSNFWQRWHISLSGWLRDYLYIPLGGNRKGKLRTYINLLITMLLGGLWHGANIRFVIWGGLHGVFLVFEKIFSSLKIKSASSRWVRFLSVFVVFHLVCFAWIFFRAESLSQVWIMLNQIFYASNIKVFLSLFSAYSLVFGVMIAGFIVHWLPVKWHEFIRGKFIASSIWFKSFIILLVLYILHFFIQSDIQPFIYFRF